MDPALVQSLEWRSIGPHRGGRVVAVGGDPVHPLVFYFGSTGGGVWKTTDGGQYWRNVSDGSFRRASVGALCVAPSDPNVIYAGMGETTIRGNVSHGDGVYRSTDAGATWAHLGLEQTRHIGRVRVHPTNPDLVYVAAFGHAHGPNPERGLYRSGDGGKTWDLVLYRGEDAGANDIAIDPQNPRIIYASFWQARRGPSYLTSGGPGSGLFKSRDGGDTWEELTGRPGMPTGLKGKIGVAVSPARSGRVWAIIEAVKAEDGGIFRSDDGGESWERLNGDLALRQRAWYYQHIHADPQHPDVVWVLSLNCWRSIDGGKTFAVVPTPHSDNHDLWIDPRDPRRMIEGNDGGACVSFDGGASWSTIYNQPTGEFYHVTTDSRVPYRLYGAQQDNTTISVPSRSDAGAITFAECYTVGGGESGYLAVRPDDPDIVYGGHQFRSIMRYDHRARHVRDVSVWPEYCWGWDAEAYKYRAAWTFPIVLSPHDPDTLYTGANVIFRTTDEGASWEPISPDLTRHDPGTLRRREPAAETAGGEVYATVFALAESPLARGLLWAGSDDGLLHLTRDGGEHWAEVTPPGLPEWALVSIVEPSPHDPAAAYIAATRHKLDDFRPYLYKTDDYGQTWAKITDGIPDNQFTRVIREDPEVRGLLYCGTEAGVYVSIDGGGHWQPLGDNLPVVPIHDLVVKDGDLVAATHGRSFWILDDITPLRQLADVPDRAADRLFRPRDSYRFTTSGAGRSQSPGRGYQRAGGTILTRETVKTPGGRLRTDYLDAGTNPPDGVVVWYALRERPRGTVRLSILDGCGQVVRSFSSEHEDGTAPVLPAEPGLNRFVWDMRHPGPTRLEEARGQDFPVPGPLAPPGDYRAQLAIDTRPFTEPFRILRDPRVPGDPAGLVAQLDLLTQIRDRVSELNEAINRIRALQQQLDGWLGRGRGMGRTSPNERVVATAREVREALTAIEEELIQNNATTIDDGLNVPARLNAKLAMLADAVATGYAAPTKQAYALFADLSGRLAHQLERLGQVLGGDVAAFNDLVREVALPAIGS